MACACKAPDPEQPAQPQIEITSNAVPAGMVRVHQFYYRATLQPLCEVLPSGLGVCVDDQPERCGAVDDFPENQVPAIKTFYSGCTLVKEYIASDHTELIFDCANCAATTVACTCGSIPNKTRLTCTHPITGGAPLAHCAMLYQ